MAAASGIHWSKYELTADFHGSPATYMLYELYVEKLSRFIEIDCKFKVHSFHVLSRRFDFFFFSPDHSFSLDTWAHTWDQHGCFCALVLLSKWKC